MRILRNFANTRDPRSLSVRLRRRRFELFEHLLEHVPRPIAILDVGGRPEFWESMGFVDKTDVRIHVVNLMHFDSNYNNITTGIADATNMAEFADLQFDVVFSNSVIEHVGGYDAQARMARELRRVGVRYFVQTPNRYFPIEPHFLIPFFQFLPRAMRTLLVRRRMIGKTGQIPDPAVVERRASEIRLLSKREVRSLFPDAALYRERFCGLVKSFIAFGGWEHSP